MHEWNKEMSDKLQDTEARRRVGVGDAYDAASPLAFARDMHNKDVSC